MRVVGKQSYVVAAHPCVKHTCNKNVKFWFCYQLADCGGLYKIS